MKRQYNIKPKPTEYKGIKFRSKLEAIWAKYFDNLSIEWEYEKKYFPTLNYLPDFWIPGWIVEIKPTPPTDREIFKCKNLSVFTDDRQVAIISDYPDNCEIWMYQNGYSVDVQYPAFFGLTCFWRKINPLEAANYLRLRYVLNRKELE